MEILRRTLRHRLDSLLAALLLVTAAQAGSSVLATDSSAPASTTTKNHREITVLGYVTPWHARGKDLVNEFRGKFDIVSPVWYTVHASEELPDVYEVKGAPPAEEDVEWYKQLQEPSPDGLAPIKITPRFMLDGWSQPDYQGLVFNETRWQLLSDAIVTVVQDMGYDGAVFESSATHALAPPLSVLSESLRAEHKVLVVVSPPIRKENPSDAGAFKAHNDMILESATSLSAIADYVSIMTYDMTGPVGLESTRNLPEGSPVQAAQKQGKVREPAPNTNAEWVGENLAAFALAAESAGASADVPGGQPFQFRAEESATTFLAGLPMYGYTYPVMFFDERTGRLTQPGPSEHLVAILQGPGEAITMVDIQRLLGQFGSELVETEDGEFYFDYPKEGGFWRTFLPTPESMTGAIKAILDVLHDDSRSSGAVGVALWEVGQSSKELLSAL